MTTRRWFDQQFQARAIAAAVWTFLLQLPICLLLKLILNGSGMDWRSVLLRTCSIFNFPTLSVCIGGIIFIQCRAYKVEPWICLTRWMMLKEFFSPKSFLLSLLLGVISGLMMSTYLSIADLSPLAPLLGRSERDGLFVNETQLFAVLYGFLLGLAESWRYIFADGGLLRIPQVHRHIKVALQSKANTIVSNSLWIAVKYYAVHLLLYFLFGEILRSQLSRILNMQQDELLDTFFKLINISLAYRCIASGAVCVITIRLAAFLFQLYQIKYVSFPVEQFPLETRPLLHEALSSDIPLLQLWASRDWSIQTERSAANRGIIFTVSQTGNHPHNWTSLVSAILTICSKFLTTLEGKDQPGSAVKKEPTVAANADLVCSPIGMRSMTLKSPVKAVLATEQQGPTLSEKVQKNLAEIGENIRKRPVVQYFWGELLDAKRRQTFAKSQPIIYLVEGLSHIVSASYAEDKYGVVQKDLPAIMSMLLNLQTAIELRGASCGVIQKRSETIANPALDVVLRDILKSTVKSAIYRIVVKFKQHILNVPLSNEHKQMLEHYLEFRVG